MAEIEEAVQEQVEHAEKNKLNSMVAVMVAVTATFMALCNVKDGNIVQAMSQAQANALNSWNYFEAKSTKQAIAENSFVCFKITISCNKQ
jgi:2-methylcitrate dehydratase PrpD